MGYVCLNPFVIIWLQRPGWPFGGEIFYDEAGGAKMVRGTRVVETGC